MPEPFFRTGPDEREILCDADADPGPSCSVCGSSTEWELCEDCRGDGETEPGQLYEQDPLWYDPDDTEPCALCDGQGGWWVCINAGQPGHGTD